jgi:hypothetical protein
MQDKVPTTHHSASDEIDIREVFTAIGRFFSRIGHGLIMAILRLRHATRKFAWLIIAGSIIGATLGYLNHRTFEPYYASQLTLNSRYYTAEMLEGSIEELNLLAQEENTRVLAKKLRITPEQAAHIRSIEAQPFVSMQETVEIESMLQQLEGNPDVTSEQLNQIRARLTRGFNTYKVIATVYNVSILDALETGLGQFLKENAYVRKRVAIEQERLLAMREKLVNEQERLDRLKTLQADVYGRLAESTRTGSNNVILGGSENANDPLNVYRQDLDFYREAIQTKSQLELNQSAEIISGFTPYDLPASTSLKSKILMGAALGLATAYLIILLISLNQALNHFEARYQAKKMYA